MTIIFVVLITNYLGKKEMKKLLFFILLTIVNFNHFAQSKHAITVDDLWNMKRIGSFDISHDGSKIIFDATTYSMIENKGNANIYIVNTDGTNLKLFIDEEKNVSSPQFINNGKTVAYLIDGELRFADLTGKRINKIPSLYSGIGGVEFSKDENKIIFSSNVYASCKTQECNKQKDSVRTNSKVKAEIFTGLMYRHWNKWRGPKTSHLFTYDFKTKKYTDLTLNGKYDVPPIALGSSNDYSFSPDGDEVAFTMNQSDFLATSTNNDIFIMNIENIKQNEPVSFTKISTSKGNDNQPVYSPDGLYIAYRSMKRAGFEADKQSIILYNRITKTHTNITEQYDISAGQLVWAKDSKSIYFTAANKIYNSIYRIDIENKFLTLIAEKVVASSLKLSNDGKTLYFKNQSSTYPYDIFSINTDKTNFKRITNINNKLLAKIEMNPVETFWSIGAEDTKVQSILVKPPFFDSSKKYPLMFLIHGGPQGHWEDEFHFRWNLQMFASQGYVVVAPNPRGSVGYGQKFTDEISRDWGGKAYTDLMNAYDYALANYNFIDKKNTFAAGASYGGYMINWIEGHTNRFNALVCHAGVFNLESMYGTTEELWFPEWEMDGTPWTNRKLYEKWSPHMFVKNFKTPMLVIHGANDFRVPFGQAMELFTSLQRVGVESKLLYFPDEYHFVTKPQNAKLWWNTIYNWLNEHKSR